MSIQAGDILFTRGGAWISRAIRWATRSRSEPPTKCNHVGIVVAGHRSARGAVVVEALHRVRRHTIGQQYGGTDNEIMLMRPVGLTREQLAAIVAQAESHVGKKYGYLKIALHGLDTLLTRARGRDVYLFRRAGRTERYPICSWLVDDAFRDGVGLDFGVAQRACQPDDILDFCEARPDQYEAVTGWYRVPL